MTGPASETSEDACISAFRIIEQAMLGLTPYQRRIVAMNLMAKTVALEARGLEDTKRLAAEYAANAVAAIKFNLAQHAAGARPPRTPRRQ